MLQDYRVQHSSPVYVEGGDSLWEGEILSDSPRHAHLVNLDVGVWGDNSASREVHSLPHQVTTNTTLFGLESLLH